MKKISLLLWVLCLSMPLFAQKSTTIKGFVKQKRNSIVKLFSVEKGECKTLLTSNIGDDGAYEFSFVPEEPGFYAISDFRVNYPIYVKGGEQINVDLLEKKAVLTGENTRENKALYQWEDFANSIRYQSVVPLVMQTTYKEFFPEFTEFLTKIDSIKGAISSGDLEFDALIRKKIDYDVDYCAMMFLLSSRKPPRSDWPAYYDIILADEKFISDELLLLPEGLSTLIMYYNYTYYVDVPKEGEAFFTNTRLRGELLLYLFSIRARYYSDYEEFISENSKILTEELP